MSTRLEIQSAIEQLPESEIRNLAKWLEEYLDEKCDRQIESDVRSHGLYDSFEAAALLAQALEEKKAALLDR
jgi:inactivated superfamily I helicase